MAAKQKFFVLSFVALLFSAVSLVAPGMWVPAQAASVNGVTGVSTSPSDAYLYNTIRTTITWCVPNGTQTGDTMSLQLPS